MAQLVEWSLPTLRFESRHQQNFVYQLCNRKDKNKEKDAGMTHLFKISVKERKKERKKGLLCCKKQEFQAEFSLLPKSSSLSDRSREEKKTVKRFFSETIESEFQLKRKKQSSQKRVDVIHRDHSKIKLRSLR